MGGIFTAGYEIFELVGVVAAIGGLEAGLKEGLEASVEDGAANGLNFPGGPS